MLVLVTFPIIAISYIILDPAEEPSFNTFPPTMCSIAIMEISLLTDWMLFLISSLCWLMMSPRKNPVHNF